MINVNGAKLKELLFNIMFSESKDLSGHLPVYGFNCTGRCASGGIRQQFAYLVTFLLIIPVCADGESGLPAFGIAPSTDPVRGRREGMYK